MLTIFHGTINANKVPLFLRLDFFRCTVHNCSISLGCPFLWFCGKCFWSTWWVSMFAFLAVSLCIKIPYEYALKANVFTFLILFLSSACRWKFCKDLHAHGCRHSPRPKSKAWSEPAEGDQADLRWSWARLRWALTGTLFKHVIS